MQPFYCDYGKQISVGKRFLANFHITVLDEAPVTKDIPSNVVAVGNHYRVIKTLIRK